MRANKNTKIIGICLLASIFLLMAAGSGSDSGRTSSEISKVTEQAAEAVTETPDDQLLDNKIGECVVIDGIAVTVNSVTNTSVSLGDAYEVSITYENHSGRMHSITPYDWQTLLRTGSDKAHVGGDVSFHLDTLKDGEKWTGIVTLWRGEPPEKIQYDSGDKVATWIIEETPSSEEIESASSLEDELSLDEEETQKIILKAGQKNEYSEELTLNAGTEFEDKQIVYYLPAGTYIFKNITDYRGQVSVYSRKTHITEEGWEEPESSSFVGLVESGKSIEVTINEDEYVEIHEPEEYEVVLK